MQRIILIITLLCLIVTGVISQGQTLSGIIVDEITKQPVSDSHISMANGIATVSDSSGRFTIAVEKVPVILRITHVSYGHSDITIDRWPEDLLIIRLRKIVADLEEVQITAERMRILTEKDDFSLQDFAFDENNLWMLGYINNRPQRGRLWLANHYGDTIHSIPVLMLLFLL